MCYKYFIFKFIFIVIMKEKNLFLFFSFNLLFTYNNQQMFSKSRHKQALVYVQYDIWMLSN